MTLRATPPSNPDWGWLGRQPLAYIAELGTKGHEMRWLRHAYAWLHQRQEAASQAVLPAPLDSPKGPPEGFFPVLFAGDDGEGSLGFLTVASSAEREVAACDDTLEAAVGAATEVFDWARALNHQVDWPVVALHADAQSGGASCGLSALVAGLGRVLRLAPPDDLCATGSWENRALKPVPAGSLAGKLRVARAWGYRRLLVVKGQEGLPAQPGLEVLSVPGEPALAILELLRIVWPQAAAEAVAAALAVFDQALTCCHRDLELALATTEPFTQPAVPALPRHIAHDIRARALLHHGLTQRAEEEKLRAGNCRPATIPEGWLGDYLEYHQPAYHSILRTDLGQWEEDHPDHRKLAAQIRRLSDAQHSRISQRLALLFLRNTLGRVLEYDGRFHKDTRQLERAWVERTALVEHWAELLEYCRKLRLRDCDLRRQHNQCLDVIGSYWEIAHELPDWQRFPLWVESTADVDFQRLHGWDFAAVLQWHGMTAGTIAPGLVEAACAWLGGQDRSYPATLVAERLLRFPGANAAQLRTAAAFLQGSSLFGPHTGILSLLGLRAAYLLRRQGFEVPAAEAPPKQSPAGQKYKDLASRPDDILARCPY